MPVMVDEMENFSRKKIVSFFKKKKINFKSILADEEPKYNESDSDSDEINLDEVYDKMKLGNQFASFLMYKIIFYGEKIGATLHENRETPRKMEFRKFKIFPFQSFSCILRLMKKHNHESDLDLAFLEMLKVFVLQDTRQNKDKY